MFDVANLKNQYEKKGYFVIRNFFEQKFISKLIEEIINAKKTKKYYDNNGNLRRIEKLYDKGESLIFLNTPNFAVGI